MDVVCKKKQEDMGVTFMAKAEEPDSTQMSDGEEFHMVDSQTRRSRWCKSLATIKRGALCTVVIVCIIAILFVVYRTKVSKKTNQCPENCQLGGFDTPNPSLLDYGKSILDVKFTDESTGTSKENAVRILDVLIETTRLMCFRFRSVSTSLRFIINFLTDVMTQNERSRMMEIFQVVILETNRRFSLFTDTKVVGTVAGFIKWLTLF